MLALTILWAAFVHPVKSADATGATALSLQEHLQAPAAPYAASWCSATVRPAAYGLSALSRGSLVAAWSEGALCVGVDGMAGGGWTDLSVVGSVRIPITSALALGLRGSAFRRGAVGFESTLGGGLSTQIRLLLDPTWSVVCSVDDLLQLHTRFQPPSGTLRLGAAWEGAVTASAVASVQAEGAPDLHLAVLVPISTGVDLRARTGTAPLRLAAAVRLAVPSIPVLAVDVEWVGSLGMRTTWSIDLP